MIPWNHDFREEVGATTSVYPGWSQLLQIKKNISFALTDTLTDVTNNHLTKRNRQGRYEEWEQQKSMHCSQSGWSNCVGWHSYESRFKDRNILILWSYRASNLGETKEKLHGQKLCLGCTIYLIIFFLIENCWNVVLLQWRSPVSYMFCVPYPISHVLHPISYVLHLTWTGCHSTFCFR